MAFFIKNIQTTGDFFVHEYSGTDMSTLIRKVEDMMAGAGYKHIEGAGTNSVYEKGNRIMRILFGAFVKYFKFAVQLKQDENGAHELKVTKHSSGISGGLIGISQVKKELKRLAELMRDV